MFEQILSSLHTNVFYKDHYGKFQYCNELFAKTAEADSPKQIIGKTDHDMIWREQADAFRAHDAAVMQGQPLINFREIQTRSNKTVFVLVSKKLFYNSSNKCIGLVGSFIDIDMTTFYQNSEFYVDNKKQLVLSDQFNNAHLSKRETEILKDILLGKTAKKIATERFLSKRTVESYTEQIKNKFLCTSKMELVSITIRNGMDWRQLQSAGVQ